MVQWPAPTSFRQLRGFLGLAGFVTRFIKNYTSLSHNLTELLEKEAFRWHPNTPKSFDALNIALT